MKNNLVIAIATTAFVAGGGGFWGGIQYQKNHSPSFPSGMPTRPGGGAGQFGNGTGVYQRGGFAPVSGKIIGVEGDSITVELPNQGSKVVILSDSTKVNKTSEGSKEDLTEGTEITAFGETNSDGSVTASNIQVGTGMMRVTSEIDTE